MLTLTEIPGTNILEFTLDGRLTREEFDRVAAKADEMIRAHGKVRVIEIVKHFGAIEPSALWADLKWEPRHLKDFTHVAVVADQKWIEWIVAACKMFIAADMRTFHLDELDQARAWIQSADDPANP